MFGQLGQIANVLKNAGALKQQMEDMKNRLKEARFVGEAGGGQVQATVDGGMELVALRIDPDLLAGHDKELLEDLIVASVAAAQRAARDGAQKEMEALTGSMGLGGMMGMLGQ